MERPCKAPGMLFHQSVHKYMLTTAGEESKLKQASLIPLQPPSNRNLCFSNSFLYQVKSRFCQLLLFLQKNVPPPTSTPTLLHSFYFSVPNFSHLKRGTCRKVGNINKEDPLLSPLLVVYVWHAYEKSAPGLVFGTAVKCCLGCTCAKLESMALRTSPTSDSRFLPMSTL